MADTGKLWLDSDLFYIPILMCNVEDQDYPAIMSRFHYLLLKKDKKTYEEIVRYWAILIITAPNTFYRDKLYKTHVFSKVYEKTVRLGRTLEKIELPPGQPRLEDAEKFEARKWKTNLDEELTKKMDDQVVYEWYTDPVNTMAARAFFGIYCMNLLRAFTKPPSNVVKYCINLFDFYRTFSFGPKPDRNISFGPGSATFLRNAFRSQDSTYRKVLRMVLDWCYFEHQLLCAPFDDVTDKFIDYAVHFPLSYFGLDPAQLMIDTRSSITNIRQATEMAAREELTLAVKRVDSLISFFTKVNSQNESFLHDNAQFRNRSCHLWRYSRLISPEYLKLLAREENLEFLAFCAGLRGQDRSILDSIYCLRKLPNRVEYCQLGERIHKEVWDKIFHRMRT